MLRPIIVIKDTFRRMEARAIVRLLIDGQGKPALMLERIYPELCSQSKKNEILSFAVNQSERLDLPLFVSGTDRTLSSLSAPFVEYVDALAMVTDGTYDLQGDEIMRPMKIAQG